MRIDATEVRRLAGLARLRVEDDELPRLAGELSAVLTHLDRLARVMPASPEPVMGEPVEAGRDDEPTPSLHPDVVATLPAHWRAPYLLAPASPVLGRDGGRGR
jgi:aspartyl-tRNA(Asn)/glutamyl-tRNA(Gln) amidotransferase subunit C